MNDTKISRRTVAQGAAWSVPAISMAAMAPSVAASCPPVRATTAWESTAYVAPTNPRGGTQKKATYTWPDPDGSGPLQPLTLTITQNFGSCTLPGSQVYNGLNKGTITNYNFNLRPSTDNNNNPATIGGTGRRGLTIHQAPVPDSCKSSSYGTSNRSDTTFTFSQPVENLSFKITDIDSNDAFRDAVAITSSSAFTSSSPYALVGTGSMANPWTTRAANGGDVDNWNGTDGNVDVTFSEPVTSFTLYYWNTRTGTYAIDSHQRIYLSRLDFLYVPC